MENRIMLQRISNSFQGKNKRFAGFAAAVLAVSLGCSIAPLFAQEPGQRTFASTEEASRALFHVMQLQDEQAPLSILGQAGKAVVSSGDPQEDMDARTSFIATYQEMQRLATEDVPTATLVVWAETWRF